VICPCFDTTFIGFCVACSFPYVPSIAEKDLLCFSERFASCAIYLGTCRGSSGTPITVTEPDREVSQEEREDMGSIVAG